MASLSPPCLLLKWTANTAAVYTVKVKQKNIQVLPTLNMPTHLCLQGIGAYNTTVEVDGDERMVCFLDTPGHEAFSAMRARGAQVRLLLMNHACPRLPLSGSGQPGCCKRFGA